MSWTDLLAAIALVMVIEGLSPSISPAVFRQTLRTVSELPDRVLRAGGLALMLVGATLLYFVRHT